MSSPSSQPVTLFSIEPFASLRPRSPGGTALPHPNQSRSSRSSPSLRSGLDLRVELPSLIPTSHALLDRALRFAQASISGWNCPPSSQPVTLFSIDPFASLRPRSPGGTALPHPNQSRSSRSTPSLRSGLDLRVELPSLTPTSHALLDRPLRFAQASISGWNCPPSPQPVTLFSIDPFASLRP